MPPESVVESMGKIVAQHGAVKRGLEIENYAKEAVVHWNAPPPALARELCIAALKLHCGKNKSAKKRDWRTAFVHTKGRPRPPRQRRAQEQRVLQKPGRRAPPQKETEIQFLAQLN